MIRELYYDKSRRRHIIKVINGKHSLQLAYTALEFRDADLERDYRLLENKLWSAIDTEGLHA